ncbi:uncharacterized protein LOC142498618 isoform X2 [Ascaphus truei]|uniref:uncharacterized protein LOC142498618 isoform X2 n=1 Tax=Ascaphus truei TaxID=8439 RepID=UPI003F59304C
MGNVQPEVAPEPEQGNNLDRKVVENENPDSTFSAPNVFSKNVDVQQIDQQPSIGCSQPDDMRGKCSRNPSWKMTKSKKWKASNGISSKLQEPKPQEHLPQPHPGSIKTSSGSASSYSLAINYPVASTEPHCQSTNQTSIQGGQVQKELPKPIKPSVVDKSRDNNAESKKERGLGNLPTNGAAGALDQPCRAAMEQLSKFPLMTHPSKSLLPKEGIIQGISPMSSTSSSQLPKKSPPGKGLKYPEPLAMIKKQIQVSASKAQKPSDISAPSPSGLTTGHKPDVKEVGRPDVAAKARAPKNQRALAEGIHKGCKKDKEQTCTAKLTVAGKLELTKTLSSATPHVDMSDVQKEGVRRKNDRSQRVPEKPSLEDNLRSHTSMVSSFKVKTEEGLDLICYMKEPTSKLQPASKPQFQIAEAKQRSALSGFSYADALKQNPQLKPPHQFMEAGWPLSAKPGVATEANKVCARTPKTPSKEDTRVLKKQTFFQQLNKSNNREKGEELQEIMARKAVQFCKTLPDKPSLRSGLKGQNTSASAFPKPEHENHKPMVSSIAPQPISFTYTGAKPKFDWIAPPKLSNYHFQFNGSGNADEKKKGFMASPLRKPEIKCQDKTKAQGIFLSWSDSSFPGKSQHSTKEKAQEQQNVCSFGAGKQEVKSVARPAQNQSLRKPPHPYLAPAVFTFPKQEQTKTEDTISELIFPLTVGPDQVPPGQKESLSKARTVIPKPGQELPKANAKVFLVHTDASAQVIDTTAQPSQAKTQPLQSKTGPQSRIKGKGQAAPTKGSKFELVLQWSTKRPMPSDIQPPDQLQPPAQGRQGEKPKQTIREPEPVSDEQTIQEPQDEDKSVKEEASATAPGTHLPRRWKDFQVDNFCTMKSQCKHRPAKLPPNVSACIISMPTNLSFMDLSPSPVPCHHVSPQSPLGCPTIS